MEPWICPRCQTVWAGWVAKCTCKPLLVTTDATAREPIDSVWLDAAHEYIAQRYQEQRESGCAECVKRAETLRGPCELHNK